MRDLHKNHKKPTLTLIALILALLTAGTAGALSILGRSEPPTSNAPLAVGAQVEPATTVRFTAQADKTVLEQLQQVGKVTTKDSQYGPFVESINGFTGGTDNKYWSYYVDGQMANIGAGEYRTIGGEEIIWRFE
jgi:hypothetical protein